MPWEWLGNLGLYRIISVKFFFNINVCYRVLIRIIEKFGKKWLKIEKSPEEFKFKFHHIIEENISKQYDFDLNGLNRIY